MSGDENTQSQPPALVDPGLFSGSSQPVLENGSTAKETQPPSTDVAGPQIAPTSTTLDTAATFVELLKHRYTQKKKSLKAKAKPPGGFDSTPLPTVPPGYTVKFTFHRAKGLPIADVHTGSSDPFISATLSTNPPNALKRHKEDPDLVHRTRPARRSLDPEWNEEWVVANVPTTGFRLKCRLYDEDYPAKDDRLGNVTIDVPRISEDWNDFAKGQSFKVKKRSGNKYAYLFKILFSILGGSSITPTLWMSIEVLGKSDPPYGKMYTVGPTGWVKHFSPMIGRLVGMKVNKREDDDVKSDDDEAPRTGRTRKYDFQANEMQLSGAVPPRLYHRYVEFRPFVALMFSRSGIRGRFLNAALHKQHRRVYNYDSSTQYGAFSACSEDAAVQLLRMAHFDEGGRLFTYVLTLDGMLRFTETGKEFGIDLLSKHTMHSNVATYIACSGEFFIQREDGHGNSHRTYHRRAGSMGDEQHSRMSIGSWKSWKIGSSHRSPRASSIDCSKDVESEKSSDGSRKSRSGSRGSGKHDPPSQHIAVKDLKDPHHHHRHNSSHHSPSSAHLHHHHHTSHHNSPSRGGDNPPKVPQHESSGTQTSSFMRALRPSRLFSHSPSTRPKTSHATTLAPPNPSLYRLYIDNDSGTYRPDKSVLPDLREYLEAQFPGLNITVMDCADEKLIRMKREQREVKKTTKGARINMVMNRSPSASSFSSGDESMLDEMERREEESAEEVEIAVPVMNGMEGARMEGASVVEGKGKGKEVVGK